MKAMPTSCAPSRPGPLGTCFKDVPRDDLFKAVRAAAAGESFLATAVATRVVERVRVPAECPLSEREVQVLDLVAAGASNKEIAQQLRISGATVKTHLIHIFGKLNVNDRTAAATVALQMGILHLRK